MEFPKIASREEWLAARLALLAKEKELSRAQAALAAERRALPMVEIDKDYAFTGPHGTARLADLFAGRRQLIIYQAGPGEQVLIRCVCGPGYDAPSPGRRRPGSRQRLCIDPVERGIQFIQAHPGPPGGLVRQVRGQRRAILKVGEVIYVDQRRDRLAVLADGDWTVTLPRLGDELTQVRLSRGQRIGHASTVTPGSDYCGQEHA
jgi:hypothetical protein